MSYEKDPDEVGALWSKTGRKGEYLTGNIEGVGPVVCFAVKSAHAKAPTWRVLKAKPRAEKGISQAAIEAQSTAVADDDILF